MVQHKHCVPVVKYIFNMIISKSNGSSMIVLVNDRYHINKSIKDLENDYKEDFRKY